MALKAIQNKIFIIKDTPPEKIGSIHIPKNPNSHYDPPYTGVIVSVGEEVTDVDLKKGTRIAFGDMCGTHFKHKDNLYFCILDTDVLAVIENV